MHFLTVGRVSPASGFTSRQPNRLFFPPLPYERSLTTWPGIFRECVGAPRFAEKGLPSEPPAGYEICVRYLSIMCNISFI